MGKTELSKFLANHLNAVHLRIDTIEQELKNAGLKELYDEGYRIAFAMATENLKNGLSVVADSTNPVQESRKGWRDVARKAGSNFAEIEIICSEIHEHRERVETRTTDIQALLLPDWQSVISREYEPWTSPRTVLDTAGKTPEQSKQELIQLLGCS